MVHPAGKGFDDTLHLELEEQGGQLSDGDAGLYAENVQLQVVGLLKQADNLLFWFREIREEISFDSIG